MTTPTDGSDLPRQTQRLFDGCRVRVARRIWILEYELAEARDMHIAFANRWRAAFYCIALGLMALFSQQER
jgi:hypothetical protein